jgi:hypothetical protein
VVGPSFFTFCEGLNSLKPFQEEKAVKLSCAVRCFYVRNSTKGMKHKGILAA